ncbi:hypothetical protein LJC57_05735 [Parabacteroides sp. OttesenSCG-928-G07]|nr:hypothetical protein [Parabacteroides sp. OttesenSCG-928-G21]MDL2278075.1 hypothetical protein [Parabacteroides sp. OttesenSCG-928-G07]
MKLFNRILYLGYYIKESDWGKISLYTKYVKTEFKIKKIHLWLDMLYSSLKFNISFMDYFCFHFWNKNSSERDKWAGTGFMYEYQKMMNPKPHRSILENKSLFLQQYKNSINHKWFSLDMLIKDRSLLTELLSHHSGKIVLKNAKGQCGKETEVIETKGLTAENLIEYMSQNNFDLAEEYIIQHKDLMNLSPSGLNTVRVITQITEKNDVIIIASRLRISVNSHVDNMAAGNMAAPIDTNTGIVNGKGVYSDITKKEETFHPITQIAIEGFQIPYWNEVLDKVKQMALLYPKNRSVGWDIAITEEGIDCIEGNHNWCKLLWQLPVNKGLKSELLDFLQNP